MEHVRGAGDKGAEEPLNEQQFTDAFGFETLRHAKRSSRREHRANSMDIARAVFRARTSGISNPLDYSMSRSDSSHHSLSIPQYTQEESMLSQHCRRISTVASKEGSAHGELGRFATSDRTTFVDTVARWACGGRAMSDNEFSGFANSLGDKQLLRAEMIMGLLGAAISVGAMIALIAVYGALGVGLAAVGPAAHVVWAAGCMVAMRFCNLRRVATVRANYEKFCAAVAASLVATPVAAHVVLGGCVHGGESHSLVLTLLGPLLVLLCMPPPHSEDDLEVGQGALRRRLFSSAVWSSPFFSRSALRSSLLARSLLVAGLVAASLWMPKPPAAARSELRWLPSILTTLLFSFLVTAAFRFLMLRFLEMKRELEGTLQQEELEKCKIEHLVHTLVPEFRAEGLRAQPPAIWYRNPPDLFADCSILQMDISGFTQLSTTISAEELIDVINAIFTSIDRLAAAVGEVWKVETIGDCYLAVLGGPLAREGHGERAVVLGLHIVEVLKRISRKIQIDLGVRIGIHSGQIAAAVVGCELPRYLTFGRDCEIVSALEASAERGAVVVSEAVQLAQKWALTPLPTLRLRDGSGVGRLAVAAGAGNSGMLERMRQQRPRLRKFFADFCASVSVGLAGLPSTEAAPHDPALSTWPLRCVSETTSAQRDHSSSQEEEGARRESEEGVHAEMRKSISELVQRVGEVSQPRRVGKRMPAESVEAVLQGAGGVAEGGFLGRRRMGGMVGTSPMGSKKDRWREVASWHGAARSKDGSARAGSAEKCWSAHGRLGSGAAAVGKMPLMSMSGGREAMEVRSDLAVEVELQPSGEWEGEGEECGEEAGAEVSVGTAVSVASSAAGRWALAEEELRKEARRWLVALFLGAAAVYGALLGVLQAVAPPEELEGLPGVFGDRAAMVALPLAYAGIAATLAAAVLGRAGRGGRAGAAGWGVQMGAGVLLVGPVCLFGSLRGPLASVAPLWGFLGVVLQCSLSGSEEAAWLRAAVAHAGVVVGVHVGRGMAVMEGAEEEGWAVPGWMVVMYGLGQVVPGTLALLPLAATVQELRDDQVRGRQGLYQHQLHKMREEALLNALVPPSIGARMRGGGDGQRIASRYGRVTVLFLYVDGCQDLFLQRDDPAPVIAWLNTVFGRLDRLLSRSFHQHVCKVETLHNVYLAVSGCPEPCAHHARESLAAALEMIAVATSVLRPDGMCTAVKVGLATGSICAGVIGTENPRFSIYGDTVNTASRMASSSRSANKGAPFVHLAQSSAITISQSCSRWLESRGLALSAREEQLEIKGKGIMQTYYVAASRPYAQIAQIDEPPPYTPHTTG